MKKLIIAGLLSGLPFFTAAAQEEKRPEEQPLWEIGLFGGAARLPHYRGSDEHAWYVLPLPYLIYRGETVRANREGVKGIFWQSDRHETSLSFSGSPPVSDDNEARRGMPELGGVLEAGPGVKLFLNGRDARNPFYLTAGIRAAVSFETDDLGMAYRGIRGGVKLLYRNNTLLKDRGISFGLNAVLLAANRENNAYVYDVAAEYATAERPEYHADGGYAGFSFSANAVKKLNDRWFAGLYYRWDNSSATAFADSPLVKTENNHIIGFALIWRIAESDRLSRYASE